MKRLGREAPPKPERGGLTDYPPRRRFRGHMTPIERAIEIAGGQTALGKMIGRAQSVVRYWMLSGRPAADEARAIEKATKGKVTAAELRPDIFGKP